MNANERLDKARADVQAGRYEEALRGYIWFHDHALEERRSLYGVRLSYALDEWVELGRLYPPAMHELKAKRDEKSAQLGRGEGDRGLFHDVESINEYLADYESTYDLFVRLMGSNTALADKCADLAVPDDSTIGIAFHHVSVRRPQRKGRHRLQRQAPHPEQGRTSCAARVDVPR